MTPPDIQWTLVRFSDPQGSHRAARAEGNAFCFNQWGVGSWWKDWWSDGEGFLFRYPDHAVLFRLSVEI